MKIRYVIDTHEHIGYWPKLKDTTNNLLESSKIYGLSFQLISFDGTEFNDEKEKNNKLLPQLEGSKKTLSFVKRNHHFGMLVWVRPHTERNYKDIDNFIEKNRKYIYGLKFHPYCSRLKITDNRFKPYIKIAQKYNLPILVHTANEKYSDIKLLSLVAKKYPNVTFIAAHLQLNGDFNESLACLKNTPNLYGDTAWVNMRNLRKLKKYNLLDRVMFGTDNPIDGLYTLSNPIYQDYFHNFIKLTKKEYEMVMYKNAIKIYNIDKKLLKLRFNYK